MDYLKFHFKVLQYYYVEEVLELYSKGQNCIRMRQTCRIENEVHKFFWFEKRLITVGAWNYWNSRQEMVTVRNGTSEMVANIDQNW